MPRVLFAVISVPAVLYALMGVLIGTSSVGRLITTSLVIEGLMCLGALAAIGLIGMARRR
ncbi:MAG TPA: hypothetical protein VGL20_21405 [Candidatus Dormibacteraeota bacterium]